MEARTTAARLHKRVAVAVRITGLRNAALPSGKKQRFTCTMRILAEMRTSRFWTNRDVQAINQTGNKTKFLLSEDFAIAHISIAECSFNNV